MRTLFVALSLLLFAVPALPQAQPESTAIRTFAKEFRSTSKRPATLEQRSAALSHLEGHDSDKVAKALVDAFRAVDAEITAVDAERAEINAEIGAIIKGKEFDKNRTLPKPLYDRYHELRALSVARRAQVDGLRELKALVVARIAELQSIEALSWMVKDVLRDKRLPPGLKLTAAHAAGALEDMMVPDLHAALNRAKRTDELCAILDGLGLAGIQGRDAADDIIALLAAKDAAVRERAALALSRIAVPEAIDPMIKLLAKETGPPKKRVAAALEILTGQQHGTSLASWLAWWEAERASYMAGEHDLGEGEPSQRADESRNYYFDIPQDGRSMIYIIDSSGSMSKEIALKTKGTVAEERLTTRLEGCKEELIAALGRLNKDQMFNVIWYSDLPHVWREKMRKASRPNVESAQDWIRVLEPNSTTNIHDSLQEAFRFAGQGAKDKHYGIELDTVFLLTDGSPTKPDGTLDSTEKILVAVREWNALKRVVVHTIGIGGELNQGFLRRLARENGGEFKKH